MFTQLEMEIWLTGTTLGPTMQKKHNTYITEATLAGNG